MTTDELIKTERGDMCLSLAHEVRNRLTCAHGVVRDVVRQLERLQGDMNNTMQGLQAEMDTARLSLHLIDPAGMFEIRCDAMGDGAFGASRRSGGQQYTHRGVDTLVTPGDSVRSPMSGVIEREGLCYAGEEYRLLVIVNWPWEVRVLYVEPLEGIVGKRVHQGQILGTAQNICSFPGREYGVRGMLPHLHTEARRFEELVDPAFLMGIA